MRNKFCDKVATGVLVLNGFGLSQLENDLVLAFKKIFQIRSAALTTESNHLSEILQFLSKIFLLSKFFNYI
jgi:hypothetical protein